MKTKILLNLLLFLFVLLSCLPARSQGYFLFATAPKVVWDDYSPTNGGASSSLGNVNVAFLWGPSNAVPLIQSLQASVPTNAAPLGQTWSLSNAWTRILGDPSFHLATNDATANLLRLA